MTALNSIEQGQLLRGVIPGMAVEVISASLHGPDAVSLVYRKPDGSYGDRILQHGDEDNLQVVDAESRPFDADAATFKLAAEAQRIKLAGLFDPMLAVTTSDIQPLPHQLRAVYGELVPRTPLRFLLADDPGAGKTIMAGLYIKELMLREDVKRCLIVAPGGLVDQWQDELRFKFGLRFDLFSRDLAEGILRGSAFDERPFLIARMDQLARSEELVEELEQSEWDLVVVDEAHRMGAHYYPGKVEKTKRFLLGETLGRIARHLLLMTATPHAGNEDDFQLFLTLLDRDRFEGKPVQGVTHTDTSGLMRRMVKEDLLTFDGKPLFPERIAETVPYELTPEERALYEEVTEYVRQGMNRAAKLEGKRKNTVGFALTVLQRRLASSPEAIYQSLLRRSARLERHRQDLAEGKGVADPNVERDLDFEDFDADEYSAEQYEDIEEELVDAATAARTIEELDIELADLARLIEHAKVVRASETDKKWSELRDARNDWAHMKSFSDDDAYRILDTAERFLTSIGSADTATGVRQLRLELRRVASDKDDRRVLKASLVMPDSDGLQPWRNVLRPHDDVATGNFQAAEFAADLYKVSVTSEDAGSDYSDPVEFFARTYLTEGLRDLIGRAVRRLSGDDNASPVINLQTNFGGGKTHSMLALWHLAAGLPAAAYVQDVQELFEDSGYSALPDQVNRVALVGNHTSPSGSVKPDGTQVNTLWGELAWQLGGADAFEIVAQSDRDRTPPGEALHRLISDYSPAVILIDEWVAYARSLVGRDDLAGGTFDDQFTFAQSLTEAVSGATGVLLAISIPASESGDDSKHVTPGNAEEVGGSNGLEALKRLQNVVRRVADQWRPASADESYHIVRQRLFVPAGAEALAAISVTAKRFGDFYRANPDEFPRDVRDIDYEERIKRTYPIHPELFDRLYEDWSSLERFQRTRGVLRLMNTVIHALWIGEDQSPLILPASIPLATASVNAELTQYLQDSWKPIIDADVDGDHSEPWKIDKEKPLFGGRSITKRLARTVFFGAAPTIGTSHKGLETQRVFLGTAVPGDVVGNFHSALNQLADRATYFYSGSGKYWYDLQANITRRAKDQADRLHKEEVWTEIARRLADQAKTRGSFAGVHVCPEESGDIADADEARLVILHPRLTHRSKAADSTARLFAQQAAEHKGGASRVNRNMVVFLAADEARMDELDQAIRTYLGWKDVSDHADELDLTTNQKNQAADKQRQASETAASRLLGTYQWALVPSGQPITIGETKVEGQSTPLAERVSRRLTNDGQLYTEQAGGPIRFQIDSHASSLWKDGHVSVGDLWRTYAQYPYMPRLTNRSVLDRGLLQFPLLWEQEGYALADGYDTETARYRGLVLPGDQVPIHISDQTLVVKPEIATAQRAETAAASTPDSEGDQGATVPQPTTPGPNPTPGPAPSPSRPTKTRFFGTKQLSSERYAMDFKNIADEILEHLIRADGTTVKITLEIEANNPDGFDESQVRVVSENASTLKFEQSSFEDQ